MLKKILLTVLVPYITLPWKEVGNVLIWSLKLYIFILIPYFAAIVTGLLLMLLTGDGNLYGIPHFTRAYFYDGHFIFTAWRIHLTYFIVCVFIVINEEFK